MQKPSKVAKVELEGAGWRGLQLRCVGKGLGSRCLEANAGELGGGCAEPLRETQ